MPIWPIDAVMLLDDCGHNGVRFGLADLADPRLTIEDGAAVARLRELAPQIFKAIPPRRRPSVPLLAVTFLAIGSLIGAYFAMPYLTGPIAGALPDTWFEEIGRTSVEQIGWMLSDEEDSLCEDDDALRALESLTARLAASLDDPPNVTLHVVNGGMVNDLI